MNLMDTMERTLQTNGQNGLMKMVPPTPHKMRWPAEFRRPIDDAMNFDSSRPQPSSRFVGTPPPLPDFFG